MSTTPTMNLAGIAYRPLKRVEFGELLGLGYFDDEKIELLNGLLCLVPGPHKPAHAWSVAELMSLLVRAAGDLRVRCRLPFAASDLSEPEPDIAIVPNGDYLDDHPSTALLIIEVADSSLRQDRSVKAKIYAQAGVPEYWIVNLVDKIVEVHTEPLNGEYRRITPFRKGERIPLTLLKGQDIDVDAFIS